MQALKQSVLHQMNEGMALLTASSQTSEALALIIDGKSLTYAIEDDVKDLFLELAIGCASVICCRSSPKQKALVSYYALQPMFSILNNRKDFVCKWCIELSSIRSALLVSHFRIKVLARPAINHNYLLLILCIHNLISFIGHK